VLDHLSTPFWEGCHEHELRLQRCSDCLSVRFPPGPVCPHCRSNHYDMIVSTGRAKVYSWIVVRHPIPADVYGSEVPYVVALVQLAEGPRMPTNIVGCSPEEVRADMPLELVFKDVTATISLPQYRPAS
jgi:uncharacterized protein